MRMIRIAVVVFALLLAGAFEAGAESLVVKRTSWVSTGPDNGLDVQSSLFTFKKKVVATTSEETNIHSHYKARDFKALRNYTFTGQMRIANSGGGVGVTFHSQYKKADQYYRLRSFPGDPTFQIAPHPDGVQLITEGETNSGVAPSAGNWFNFKVTVRTTRSRTRIRAKVWQAGTRQPGWQIDCSDTSESRIKRGKVGVWSMGAGEKGWRKLDVVVRD